MPLRSGDLDQKVRFYCRGEPSAEGAAAGNPVGDWEEQFSIWAKVFHRGRGETVVESRIEGRLIAEVTVRRSRQTLRINEGWRADIRHGLACRQYNITAVSLNADRTGIDMTCVYGGPVG